MKGIFPIIYSFCGELVYPEPESTSTALNLMGMSRINFLISLYHSKSIFFIGLNGLGVVVLEIFKVLFKQFGIVWSYIFLGVVLIISLILLIFTEEKLERQDAENDPDPVAE